MYCINPVCARFCYYTFFHVASGRMITHFICVFIDFLHHHSRTTSKCSDFQMKERLERKLGLNFTFSDEDITAMYDLCRYTWDGIGNTPSPWCAVFSIEDLQVLEYIDDLRHYYRNSYGVSQYSKKFGQIPLADLLRNFEQAKKGKGKKIVSYFTHASMMDMILVVLNLNKDENPLMGAYRDIHRKMRTTFLTTFSSNLIAVLNRYVLKQTSNT